MEAMIGESRGASVAFTDLVEDLVRFITGHGRLLRKTVLQGVG